MKLYPPIQKKKNAYRMAISKSRCLKSYNCTYASKMAEHSLKEEKSKI